MLLVSAPAFCGSRGRVLGATMTSASAATFANGKDDAIGGTRELTIMFAVEVGDKCKVKGCARPGLDDDPENEGFGSARIWESRFSSRNVACNSITTEAVQ